MHHPTDRITHTVAFVTSVVEHWLEREIAQWVHHEGSIRQPMDLHLAPKRKEILTTEMEILSVIEDTSRNFRLCLITAYCVMFHVKHCIQMVFSRQVIYLLWHSIWLITRTIPLNTISMKGYNVPCYKSDIKKWLI